jgi:hypothetical protein
MTFTRTLAGLTAPSLYGLDQRILARLHACKATPGFFSRRGGLRGRG